MDGDLAVTPQARQRSLPGPAGANRRNSRRVPESCLALNGISQTAISSSSCCRSEGLVRTIKEIRRDHRIQAKLIARFISVLINPDDRRTAICYICGRGDRIRILVEALRAGGSI